MASHPTMKFLLHGGGDDWITDLMERHRNVYYSPDNLVRMFGWEPRHARRPPTKEEFLEYARGNFDFLFARALGRWKAVIEVYPDRFMWGTDRGSPSVDWSFDHEVGGVLLEFSRAFIGQLDPAVQEKFAYQNAEELLGK